MNVILRSAEMFYVGASWNNKGSSWQRWTNRTVKPLSITQGVVKREKKKCRKITDVGKN